MNMTDTPAAWRVADLEQDRSWEFNFDDRARRDLLAPVEKAYSSDRSLLDYRREEFDLGSAAPVLEAALNEVKHGRGIALIRGLPREGPQA